MRKIIHLLVCIVITQVAHSQTHFISSGKVHYNANFYLQSYWPQIEASNRMPFIVSDNIKILQFSYNLLFNNTQSSFEYDRESSSSSKYIEMYFHDFQWITMDYYRKFTDSIYYKKMGSEQYKAPLPKIVWKITSESRQIAGFDCQRANGLVNDSIYIVAYFTEQIFPSVGPFGLRNLPGAILGLAIPDMHISYFADKVEENIQKSTFKKPSKAIDFQTTTSYIFPQAKAFETL